MLQHTLETILEMSIRIKRPGAGFLPHPSRFALVGLCAFFFFLIACAPHAQAQNLVQDPNFFQGFQFYATSGRVISQNVPFGPPPPTQGGPNSAEMIAPGAGGATAATITQTIATVPNTTYLVTFAVSLDPNTTDSFMASFGNGSKKLTQSPSNGKGFDIFTFTGKSSVEGTTTNLTFTTDLGATLISELDVQVAPAPVTGGGLLSVGAAIVGFAVQRRRRAIDRAAA
jgi:hypothetical protein